LVRFCTKKRNFTDRPNTNRVNRVAQAQKSQEVEQEVVPGDTALVNKECVMKLMLNENVITATEHVNAVGECQAIVDDVCNVDGAVPELGMVHPLKHIRSAIAVADGDPKGDKTRQDFILPNNIHNIHNI